jgi:hypothetical protein
MTYYGSALVPLPMCVNKFLASNMISKIIEIIGPKVAIVGLLLA